MSELERADILIQKYLDEIILPVEMADLEKLLISDSIVRQRFIQTTQFEHLLVDQFRRSKASQMLSDSIESEKSIQPEILLERQNAPGAFRTRKISISKWIALAASVVMILGVYYLNMPADALPLKCIQVTGDISLIRGKDRYLIKPGQKIQGNDQIIVSKEASAVFQYSDDQTTLNLYSETKVLFKIENGAKRVRLDSGKIFCTVAKQPKDKPFVVTTPHAAASVIGTELSLDVSADTTKLKVIEGNVALTRSTDNASVNVTTGQHATIAPGVEMVAQSSEVAPSDNLMEKSPQAVSVFLQEFDVIPPEQWTSGELVFVVENGKEISALASKTFKGGSPSWKPDVVVRLNARKPDDSLYAIPDEMEIRIRIKSEQSGKCYFAQQAVDRKSKEEVLASHQFQVGQDWQTIVLRAGDFTPYRRPHVYTPDLSPGMRIGFIGIFGTGTGEIFIDRFEVLSSTPDNPEK
jgi:hypothetical protein